MFGGVGRDNGDQLDNTQGTDEPRLDREGNIDDTKQVETETILRVKTEVYSRIVGYIRPIQNWNKGKKQEFEERKVYKVDVSDTKGGQG